MNVSIGAANDSPRSFKTVQWQNRKLTLARYADQDPAPPVDRMMKRHENSAE
jgi:hypothetical protein